MREEEELIMTLVHSRISRMQFLTFLDTLPVLLELQVLPLAVLV